MSKKRKMSTNEQRGIRRLSRVILACISLIGLTVVYGAFDSTGLGFLLLVLCGLLVVGFLFARKSRMRRNLSTSEYWLIVCWLLLSVMFYIWKQMLSDSFYTDTEFYVGVGMLLVAVATYSFSFALLWDEKKGDVKQKNRSWQETLIDRPYFRPSIALITTTISYLILLFPPGVPKDIFAEDYQRSVQIIGSINLIIAITAVVLSIVSVYKVQPWFKVIFVISTLVALGVIAFQILGIALSGGIY